MVRQYNNFSAPPSEQVNDSSLEPSEADQIQSQVADLHRAIGEINQILQAQSSERSPDQIAEDKLRCQALVSEARQIYTGLPYEWQIKLMQISQNLLGIKPGSSQRER